MQVDPPEGTSVPAGQSIEVYITLTGSCPTPGIYTVRADLTNVATSQTISTNRTQFNGNGAFTGTISDSAVVPAGTGTWRVLISVYILSDGFVVGPASQLTVDLNVVPYTQTATIETQSPIQTTSVISSSIQSTINLETTTQPSSVNSETQPTGTSISLSESDMLIAAAAAILVAVMWVILRKKRVKPRGTEIYLEDRGPSKPRPPQGTEIFGERTEDEKSEHEED